MSARFSIGAVVTVTFVVLGAVLVLLPFVWMLALSVKPDAEIFAPGIDLLPSRIEWRNYAKAFAEAPLFRFLFNGVVVCAGILVFQILTVTTRPVVGVESSDVVHVRPLVRLADVGEGNAVHDFLHRGHGLLPGVQHPSRGNGVGHVLPQAFLRPGQRPVQDM